MSEEKNFKTDVEINSGAGYKAGNLSDIENVYEYYMNSGTDDYKKHAHSGITGTTSTTTGTWTFPYGNNITDAYYTDYKTSELTKFMERIEERLCKLEDRLCILEECDAEEIDTLRQMFEEYKTMERMLVDKANKKKNNG